MSRPIQLQPLRWALALLCAGCAAPVSKLPELPKEAVAAEQRKQQIAQLRKYYSERHRVDTVAFRIRTANVDDCKKRIAPQLGMTTATVRSLPRRYQSYTGEALGLGWINPIAISVVEGSPAAKAGIATGDNVIAFNGEAIPSSGIRNWMNRWLRENGTTPIKVNTRRDGVDRTVTITPVMGCSIPIEYKADETSNASASHDRITIHSGIVALSATNAELALIIGHELAHSNLGHLDKTQWNRLLGAAGGAAIDATILAGGVSTGSAFKKQFERLGANAFSVGFEREADYVGAYYAARAGYDLKGAEQFWAKFALGNPASILVARTHPVSPVRFVQIQQVTAEIDDKKRRGLPLMPEMKYITVDHNDADILTDATADDSS